jgi:MFS family permease
VAVLAVAVLAGAGAPLVTGGFSSLMPGLVPAARLPRANALESMTYGLADVAGPGLAGALAAAFGAPAALGGQMALAAVCLVLLATLPATAPPADERPQGLRARSRAASP